MQALGILEGKSDDGEYISVHYIQRWRDIKIGDEVYTNGLDEIFLPNVPVGKVINIYEDSGFLRADVLPYANAWDIDYVWIVDTRNNIDIQENDDELNEKPDDEQNEQQDSTNSTTQS